MGIAKVDSYKFGHRTTQVLILHGSGSAAKPLGRLGQLIADSVADSEVTVLSLAGYGSEAADATTPILTQHLELIQHVMTAWTHVAKQRPWHLVGHSMGGYLALQTALALPGMVASLSLVEPTALGTLDAQADDDAIEADRAVVRKFTAGREDGTGIGHFIQAWNQSPWSEMPDSVRKMLTDQAAQIYAEVIGVSYDTTPLEAYAKLTTSILLLGGEQTLLPARRVLQKLAGLEQVRDLKWVAGAKHMTVVQQPEDFASAIANHILNVVQRES